MLLSGGDVMQTERPTDVLMNSLEEVSRPLNAYARAILASGS
jgi:hypothetical protein